MSAFHICLESYKNNINVGFSNLQHNEELVDMTLAAQGHLVKVHRSLVALASPYIKEMLISAPCRHPVVFLNGVSKEVLGYLLEYIYMGEVKVPTINMKSFIEAAKALHITGVKDILFPLQVPMSHHTQVQDQDNLNIRSEPSHQTVASNEALLQAPQLSGVVNRFDLISENNHTNENINLAETDIIISQEKSNSTESVRQIEVLQGVNRDLIDVEMDDQGLIMNGNKNIYDQSSISSEIVHADFSDNPFKINPQNNVDYEINKNYPTQIYDYQVPKSNIIERAFNPGQENVINNINVSTSDPIQNTNFELEIPTAVVGVNNFNGNLPTSNADLTSANLEFSNNGPASGSGNPLTITINAGSIIKEPNVIVAKADVENQHKEIQEARNPLYMVSTRGVPILIYNRYMYNLHHQANRGRKKRWRCIEYRSRRCKAFIDTDGDLITTRKFMHDHPFHDEKILHKGRTNNIYTSLKSALENSTKDCESCNKNSVSRSKDTDGEYGVEED